MFETTAGAIEVPAATFATNTDGTVYFNTGISEYEEDKNELYLVHYSDDGEITSNIVAM